MTKEKIDEMIAVIDRIAPGIENIDPVSLVVDTVKDLFTELHACIPDESGLKALHKAKYEQWLLKNGLK